MNVKRILVVFLVMSFFVFGCSSTTSKKKKGAITGAVIGTAVGAGVGYAVGGEKGAAIGAGSGLVVGGLTGAAIGSYMDKQEKEMREALAQSEAASIQREQDVLAVTFKANVMFAFNSAVLKRGAYEELDRTATVLNKYPQTRIRIEGHTDSKGSENYNLKLSERRAEAVKKALIARGIDPLRLATISFGEAQPVATNETDEGRQLNRRVRMVIIPIEG